MSETLSIKIQGTAPLLMHNGQMANPLNEWAKKMKEVSSVRKKTDEHYAEMARIEWLASLYVNDNQKLIIASDVLDAMIVEGAKKSKLGKQFKAGAWVERDALLDIGYSYDKASDLLNIEQFRDIRGVVVNMKRVQRTRPIFRKWSAVVDISYDPRLVKKTEIAKAIEDAGTQVGIGDYRPRYGRFEIV